MSSQLSYQLTLSTPFEDSVQRVKDALMEQGFGVLTEIDVQATFKKKIGENFRPYLILGACNPPFAHQALVSEGEAKGHNERYDEEDNKQDKRGCRKKPRHNRFISPP